jgi:outer membrane immunogenic protein
MNKVIFVTAGILLAVTSAAKAADLPGSTTYSAPSAVYGAYNWMGPYMGVNLGYEWGSISNNGTKPSGIAGGVQAGYNWQSGQLVIGGETDLQISGADDVLAPWKFSNPWFGTLRARAGYAANNMLFYGTAGLAYGTVRAELLGLSESKSSIGWTIGAGMEVGLTPNWSAKVEYLYIGLASRTYSVTGTSNAFSGNMLRLGVNYHF